MPVLIRKPELVPGKNCTGRVWINPGVTILRSNSAGLSTILHDWRADQLLLIRPKDTWKPTWSGHIVRQIRRICRERLLGLCCRCTQQYPYQHEDESHDDRLLREFL